MSEAKLLNEATDEQQRSYLVSLALLTLLFLMWGFITSMNDVLIPHFQNVFQLSHLQAMPIQFCFFGAYFIISVIYFFSSIRQGDLISKIGYKKGFHCFATSMCCIMAFMDTKSGKSLSIQSLKAIQSHKV